MGVLDRVNARARRVSGESRSGIDQWLSEYLLPSGMVNQFSYNGHVYGCGGNGANFTYPGSKAREFSGDLPGFTAAIKSCPPALRRRWCVRWSSVAGAVHVPQPAVDEDAAAHVRDVGAVNVVRAVAERHDR